MPTQPALLRAAVASAALTLLSLSSAEAQTLNAETRARLLKACEADAQRLCPGVRPGGGRLYDCLQKQSGQVSETCRDTMASFLQGR